MTPWKLEEALDHLPIEERAWMQAGLAYADAMLNAASSGEQRRLRRRWLHEFRRRWPERSWPADMFALLRPCGKTG